VEWKEGGETHARSLMSGFFSWKGGEKIKRGGRGEEISKAKSDSSNKTKKTRRGFGGAALQSHGKKKLGDGQQGGERRIGLKGE